MILGKCHGLGLGTVHLQQLEQLILGIKRANKTLDGCYLGNKLFFFLLLRKDFTNDYTPKYITTGTVKTGVPF